jgi:MtN3 and saliva related transmembrane protein
MPLAHDLLGYGAATLTTVSFVPQAVQVIRTGKTEDLSLVMYLCTTLGLGLWCAYGVSTGALPIAICNGITVVLASIILVMKIRSLLRPSSLRRPANVQRLPELAKRLGFTAEKPT